MKWEHSAKKSSQLGMPFGTAANQLRKQVLFSLVQRLALDTCYRCDQKICSAADLSLDHKKDWLDASPDLFWDLSNISFSHTACNAGHARRPTRIEWTDTHRWCYRCKSMRPFSDWSPARRSVRDAVCRTCHSAYERARRQKARASAAPSTQPTAVSKAIGDVLG